MKSLNDPVTVSGSDIQKSHCRKARRGMKRGTASQETCFLIEGELPKKADPDDSPP